MKKIFLAALVAIAIFSCTEKEELISTPTEKKIIFRAEAVSNDGWVDYSPTASVKY